MNGIEKAARLLPESVSTELSKYKHADIEEIRIRLNRKPCIMIDGKEIPLINRVTAFQDIRRIIEIATGASFHMAEKSIANGFICYEGLRLGVCGSANIQRNGVLSFNYLTSVAIRIPRECKGICDELIESTFKMSFDSTLVISAPGGGKTTALRELCRKLSNKGMRVAVVDERNELLADDGSGAGFDLGEHTDVLSGLPKADGIMMLMRSMNPQIIAVDEITKACDLESVAEAFGCGVSLLASAHASSVEELMQRKLYRDLLGLGGFKYIIRITGLGRNRQYIAERIRV